MAGDAPTIMEMPITLQVQAPSQKKVDEFWHKFNSRSREGDDDEKVGGGGSAKSGSSRGGGGDKGRWPGANFSPKSVKRVTEVFEDPKFYIDGPSANDVRQGRDGDCWLMAALCTLSDKPGLIERVCVARNEAVGVYGFVFHRDGEWFSEIIDDKLYLIKPDYDEAWIGGRMNADRMLWEDIDRADSEEIYQRTFQTNSAALYFAQCANPNETWLPLLEKAYAKAHGDFAAIEGGFTGEGIEDLTGGVTTEVFTSDILDREQFWGELLRANQDFLFGCSTGMWGLGYGDRKGIYESHAYSVMRAVEIDGQRLCLLKNPWGKGEWTGPWSDGSKEWTAEWLTKLDHRFGDDGAFWISYRDLLRKFQTFERTRLFGPEWKVNSMWTTLNVSWALDYHDTKFAFTLAKPGPVVIVLAQLDERYFRGLEGQYTFKLGFRVHKAGDEDYIVRSHTSFRMCRSCNVELDLEAGEYVVLVRLEAERYTGLMPPEDVVRRNAKGRRDKLLRIGLAYDLAHSKARITETPEEKAAREAYEKRKKEKHREAVRKDIMERRRKGHFVAMNKWQKDQKNTAFHKKLQKQRAAKREAKREAKRKAKEEAKKKEEEAEKEKKEDPSKKEEKEPAEVKSEAAAEGEAKATDEKEVVPEGESKAEAGEVKKDETPAESKVEKETKGEKTTVEETKVKEVEAKKEPSNAEKSATPEVKEVKKDSVVSDKSAGKNTPSVSTSETPAAEPIQVEQKSGAAAKAVKEEQKPTSESVLAEAKAPETEPKEAEGPAKPPQEPAAEGTSKEAKPAAANTHFQKQIKTALKAVSNLEKKLQDFLTHNDDTASECSDTASNHSGTSSTSSKPNTAAADDGNSNNRGPRIIFPHSHHRHHHHHHPNPFGSTGGPQNPDSDSDSDDISDICSVRSVSEIGDVALDFCVKHEYDEDGNPRDEPGSGAKVDESSDDESEEGDPWNAVAVVGLRIYYKEEDLVKLRVVRPNKWELMDDSSDEEEDEEKKEEEKVEVKEEPADETQVLDVDDSAKDAVEEVEGKAA
ncbi:hypothetical protein N0V88_000998 [Collariella sp. IMI 366227]|nr:hypothetical protein N0V88_000998 [Collariella sp. IMI 366227]